MVILNIIKKFIAWLINLFKKLFGIKDKKKAMKKTELEKKGKRYLEKYGVFVEDSFHEDFPPYMIITKEDKIKLLENAKKIEKRILKTRIEERELDRRKIFNLLFNEIKEEKDDEKKKNQIKRIDELLKKEEIKEEDFNHLIALLDGFSEEKKKEVLDVYQKIKKDDEEAKIEVEKVDDIVKIIDENDISVYESNKIDEKLEEFIDDKDFDSDKIVKLDALNKEIMRVLENDNKDLSDKVMKEYKELNYVTISTYMIDETLDKVKKLEEDYKHHRYNKYYYEREINKIKNNIDNLMKLKNRGDITKEIQKLRRELYIKSKDKYDLLYNNEIFLDLDKRCDDLLKQVNAKVVDLKKPEKKDIQEKEPEKDKEEEQRKKENEKLEKILKRFQDMELARRLILLSKKNSFDLSNPESVLDYMNKMYGDFLKGVDEKFNYERNKTKTELVKLYNDINLLNCALREEEYISIEHINFRMRDLLEATSIKKNELEKALETKYHINREELENKRMTNEKMEGLYKEENIVQKEDNHHVLKKTIEPQNIVHNTVNNQNERNKK